MSDKVIKNWLNLSDYDLETAKSMQDTGRYLYVVFTCQQCIEKKLKALYVNETNNTPPYIHNLLRLLDHLSIKTEITKNNITFIEELNTFYLETRYSEEIEKLSLLVTKEKAAEILLKTQDLSQWLTQKI